MRNMSELSQLLTQFEKQGNGMPAYEANHLNQLLIDNGMAPIAGRANQVTMGRGVKIHPNDNGDKAQFNIRVIRNSANIAQSLEVAIFGEQHFSSGYLRVLNPPIGGTVTVAGGTNVNLPDRVRFTYTVGANVDTVDVLCNELPYPAFLAAMSNANFLLSNIRYSLDNPAQLGQFSELLEVRQRSLFGKADQNEINVISFKDPDQFQAGIIDIPMDIPISREDLLVNKVAAITTDPFTLACFVQHFYKQDRSDVPGAYDV